MSDVFTFALLVFTSFLTLINPLGVMSIYMTLTSNLTPAQRTRTATKATLVSFATIVFFALAGPVLFDFFNISVNSLRIVGGVIFFVMGMDMLQARLARIKVGKDDVHEYVEDISITPLAIPMICGPGAITNAIILMEDAVTIEFEIAMFLAIGAVMSVTWLLLYGANRLIKVIGETGNKVMMRLMGLILMVIAVEFFVAGIEPVVMDLATAIEGRQHIPAE